MRKALLSVVVAVAGGVCVLALGLGLQAAALPSPRPAERLAADASKWLDHYRYSIDVFHSEGRRLGGACLRGWYPRQRGARTLRRGSLLLLQGGPVVLATGGRRHIRFLSALRRRDLPASLAIAAGCTGPLGGVLSGAAQGSTDISTERAYAANQPAIALEMPMGRDGHLTIYVSPRQYRPLVAVAAADGHTVTARIYFARTTLRTRFRYRQLLNKGLRRGFHGAP